jgi:outer membrane protein OmpA-like peptidoglycan-associated protein
MNVMESRNGIFLIMLTMLLSSCATVGDPGKGAVMGAATGTTAGTVTGVILDTQEERLRKAGIRAERDRQGDLLVRLAGEHLKFDTDKADLQPSGVDQLALVSGVLRDYPENRISIMGHTDGVGRESHNQQLSQAQAETVKATLLQQGVAPQSILSATGHGESQPVADNDVAEGRAQNRRVELRIRVDAAEASRNQAERERYARGRH